MGGLRTAEALRRFGYAGAITVIGAEVWAPYNRPPLSKEVLANVVSHQAVAFEQRSATSDVNWVLGTRAIALDAQHNTVTDENGAVHPYSALVIATGLRPRRLNLPNGELIGRHFLRTLDDAIDLRAVLVPGANVVIAGSGFVGCEVAATASKLGCAVTVIGRDSHPMLRPLGFELAAEMQRRHEAQGVKFLMHRGVDDLLGDSRVKGVMLDDGSLLPCDVFLEAVGSTTNVEWLEGNNLDLSDGVLVDNSMRVIRLNSEPLDNVYAIGDVARFANLLFDDVARRAGRQLLAEGLGQHQGRPQVGFDVIVPAFAGGALPVIVFEQRGGIDQRGEGADGGGSAVHQRGGLVFPGKISPESRNVDARGARFGGGAFGILGGAVIVDRHVPAGRRQVQGDGASQPLGGAGDQYIFHGRTPDGFAALAWSVLLFT